MAYEAEDTEYAEDNPMTDPMKHFILRYPARSNRIVERAKDIRPAHRGKISRCSGFTLLELLVSLSIVGIISAIAIPEYRAYQRRAFDIRALGDLRTVALAEEAYFMSAEKYVSCLNTACESLPGVARLSQGVALGVSAELDTFTADASHPKGTGKHFLWDSENGGLQ